MARSRRVFDGLTFVNVEEKEEHSYHDCPFLDSTGELCDDCRIDMFAEAADRSYDEWRESHHE